MFADVERVLNKYFDEHTWCTVSLYYTNDEIPWEDTNCKETRDVLGVTYQGNLCKIKFIENDNESYDVTQDDINCKDRLKDKFGDMVNGKIKGVGERYVYEKITLPVFISPDYTYIDTQPLKDIMDEKQSKIIFSGV